MMNTESRPRLKWGIFVMAFGVLSLFNEPVGISGDSLESTLEELFKMAISALIIYFGYRLARKRIVVDGNSIRLIGLVDGKSDITLSIDQVTNVAFNHLRQKVEIQTAAEKLFANLPLKSKAFGILNRAIQEAKNPSSPN